MAVRTKWRCIENNVRQVRTPLLWFLNSPCRTIQGSCKGQYINARRATLKERLRTCLHRLTDGDKIIHLEDDFAPHQLGVTLAQTERAFDVLASLICAKVGLRFCGAGADQ